MGLSKNRVPKNPLLHHRFPFKDGDLGNGIHPNIISSWWCRNMRSLFLLVCPHPHCCWVNPPSPVGPKQPGNRWLSRCRHWGDPPVPWPNGSGGDGPTICNLMVLF
jgi:hypothetical protein